jgi:phosphocarrier protein
LRAAAEIVTLVNAFDAHVLLECDGERADAHSVLSIVCLGAAPGTSVHVRASGVDAERVIHALAELFANGFGDEIYTSSPDVSASAIPPSMD